MKIQLSVALLLISIISYGQSGKLLLDKDTVSLSDRIDTKPSITTIAGLRALTKPAVYLRYYTTDLGQEGFWYYDPSDASGSDNTGTILVSSNGKRFKRIYENAINVKWFGAKGNNSNNDAGAIRAAIAATSPGGAVYIPNGTYRCNKIEIRKPLTFFGDGTNTILVLNDSATGANGAETMFLLSVDADTTAVQSERYQSTLSPGGWNYGVTIKDIRLDGGLRQYHGSALWVQKTENSKFENIFIYGFDGPALYLSTGARELQFNKVSSEYCGAWKTNNGRSRYADLQIKKWSVGEGWEAVNDIKFIDYNSFLSLWKPCEINSIGAATGINSTTRFIKFIAPTFHGFPFMPAYGNAKVAINSAYTLDVKFGMTTAEFNQWQSVYDVSLFSVTGQAQNIELHAGLLAVGGIKQPMIHFENTQYAIVNNCNLLGKADGIADSSFVGILCEAKGTNKIGSYSLTNNFIDLPTLDSIHACIPFKVTDNVFSLVDLGNQYNFFLQYPRISSKTGYKVRLPSQKLDPDDTPAFTSAKLNSTGDYGGAALSLRAKIAPSSYHLDVEPYKITGGVVGWRLVQTNGGGIFNFLDVDRGNVTFPITVTVPTPTAGGHAVTKSYVDAILLSGQSAVVANGVSASFKIAHGLTGVSATSRVFISPRTAAAAGYTYVEADATNITVHYKIAPVNAASLIYDWQIIK